MTVAVNASTWPGADTKSSAIALSTGHAIIVHMDKTPSATSYVHVIRCFKPINVSAGDTFRTAAAPTIILKGRRNDVDLLVHTYPHNDDNDQRSCADSIQQQRTLHGDSESSLSSNNAQLSNTANASIGNMRDTSRTDVNSSSSLCIENATLAAATDVVNTSDSGDDGTERRHQSYDYERECCFCDLRFASLPLLLEHLRHVHSNRNNTMFPAPGVRTRTCGYCLRILTPADELEAHLLSYHCGAQSNAYECRNHGCDARFVSMIKRQIHNSCHAKQMACADKDDVNTAAALHDSIPVAEQNKHVIIIQPQREDVSLEPAASDVIGAVEPNRGDINTAESMCSDVTIGTDDFMSSATTVTTATVTVEDNVGCNMRLQATTTAPSAINIERATGAANVTMSRGLSGGRDATPEPAVSTSNASSGGSNRCCYCRRNCTDHRQLMAHLRQKHPQRYRYMRQWQQETALAGSSCVPRFINPKAHCAPPSDRAGTARFASSSDRAGTAHGKPLPKVLKVIGTRLTEHVLLKDNDVVFTCYICSKVFMSRQGYSDHFKVKHTLELFKCQNCDKEFTSRSGCRQHKLKCPRKCSMQTD